MHVRHAVDFPVRRLAARPDTKLVDSRVPSTLEPLSYFCSALLERVYCGPRLVQVTEGVKAGLITLPDCGPPTELEAGAMPPDVCFREGDIVRDLAGVVHVPTARSVPIPCIMCKQCRCALTPCNLHTRLLCVRMCVWRGGG